MENKYQPAFPRPYSHDERPSGSFEGDTAETFEAQDGLSKREYAAIQIMAAIKANQETCKMIAVIATENKLTLPQALARMAVTDADALLKELES